MSSHLSIFALIACAFGIILKEIIAMTNVKELFPYAFFKDFYFIRSYF